MLWLTLMRHAKSDWNDDGLEDFQRPLAPRGVGAAPLMGRHLKALWGRPNSPLEGVPPPEVVLVSPAVRTRQTIERVRSTCPALPEPTFVDDIYGASVETLFDIVRHGPGSARHVLLIGHNDGMVELAADLVKNPIARDDLRAFTRFPTATVAVLALEIVQWPDLAPKCASLLHIMTPKKLIELKT